MKKFFNVAEILESVDTIITKKDYAAKERKKIIRRYERFNKKKINMTENPETEKIILDAENSQSNDDFNKTLILDNEFVENNEDVNEENYLEERIFPLKEEVIDDDSADTLNLEEKVFPLEKEYLEKNNSPDIEQLNLIGDSKDIKEENLKYKEEIKDLNTLLDSFLSQKRYTELDEKIKLYQADNAILRKKLYDFSNNESALRLQLTDLQLNEDANKKFQQSPINDNENINILSKEILALKEKNIYLENELANIKGDRESSTKNNDEKLKFYREEYAKVIIDKSDILRKLENTKEKLSINEKNKNELRVALDNLNRVLAASDIETTTFSNQKEKIKKYKL